jgi:hypothetical protein
VVSKLDLAVIVTSITGALLWIEHGHRIDIETPTGAAFTAPVAAVCPDNENVSYSANCIVFMQGDGASDMRWRVNAAGRAPAEQPFAPKNIELTAVASGAACADNDNMPYTARCIAFMTGWFWRPNTP